MCARKGTDVSRIVIIRKKAKNRRIGHRSVFVYVLQGLGMGTKGGHERYIQCLIIQKRGVATNVKDVSHFLYHHNQ